RRGIVRFSSCPGESARGRLLAVDRAAYRCQGTDAVDQCHQHEHNQGSDAQHLVGDHFPVSTIARRIRPAITAATTATNSCLYSRVPNMGKSWRLPCSENKRLTLGVYRRKMPVFSGSSCGWGCSSA